MDRNEKMVEAGFENTLSYACTTQNIDEILERLKSIKPTSLNKKCSYFGTPCILLAKMGKWKLLSF